jgi:hypothetical protein
MKHLTNTKSRKIKIKNVRKIKIKKHMSKEK